MGLEGRNEDLDKVKASRGGAIRRNTRPEKVGMEQVVSVDGAFDPQANRFFG